MHEAMRYFSTAVASFQEADINTTSAVSYAEEWKAKGCQITFSPADANGTQRLFLCRPCPCPRPNFIWT